MRRSDGRAPLEPRPLKVTPGYAEFAEGSALVELGRTRVLVTASVTPGVPPHVKRGQGWLHAEYSLLPRSTRTRTQRERHRIGGRTQEIQRFLGRALRAALDTKALAGKTVIVDADVLQADGGTRVASLIGGYAALYLALDRMLKKGELEDWPLTPFGAVSLGWFGEDAILLDLTQSEDERADADLTVVATDQGEIIEVHGGGEKRPVPYPVYQRMVEIARETIPRQIRELHRQLRDAGGP